MDRVINDTNQAVNYVLNHYRNTSDDMIRLLQVILELNLVDWVRYFNVIQGFMFGGGHNYMLICEHPRVVAMNLSNMQLATCVRECQICLGEANTAG